MNTEIMLLQVLPHDLPEYARVLKRIMNDSCVSTDKGAKTVHVQDARVQRKTSQELDTTVEDCEPFHVVDIEIVASPTVQGSENGTVGSVTAGEVYEND